MHSLNNAAKKMKETGGSFSARYPLSGKLFCGEHGESFNRHIYKSKKNGEQEVWNCRLYRLKGKVEGCDSPTIYTSEIEKILADVYRDIYENRETVIEQMANIYSKSGGSRDFTKDIAAAEKGITYDKRKYNFVRRADGYKGVWDYTYEVEIVLTV